MNENLLRSTLRLNPHTAGPAGGTKLGFRNAHARLDGRQRIQANKLKSEA